MKLTVEEALKIFSGGESWYSKLSFVTMGKDNFHIEILVIDISPELKESLISAQKKTLQVIQFLQIINLKYFAILRR
ncbi:MAG TPA: hypothetical protein PKD67_01910 [Ignavibacteriaceae bacterium]|nr:hypothetical protein [Ignavibacteriaceae bacterium]